MAKQDLVVKLLLDSGAFGNDLRMAEKKAQDFRNNLQGAGNTAGAFAKSINLSTGALGSLGSVLVGGAGVIGAIEGFKSIMLSTDGTAKEFKGTIAGFEGVLDTFQQSLATFDFSSFSRGMSSILDVYSQFKEGKISALDAQKGGIAYNLLATGYEADIAGIKTRFTKATTQEEKEALKKNAEAVVEEWIKYASDYSGVLSDSFMKQLIAGSNIKEMYVTPELVAEQLDVWKKTQNDKSKREADIAEYQKVASQLTKLGREMRMAENNYTMWLGKDAKYAQEELNKMIKATDEYNALLKENQGLFIRNQFYKMPTETLTPLAGTVKAIDDETKRIQTIKNEISSWPTTVSNSQTNNDLDPIELKNSYNELLEIISATKKYMFSNVDRDSEEFKVLAEDLREYNEELEKYNEIINGKEVKETDKDFGLEEVTQLNQSGSLNNIKSQIELTEFLLTEREKLRDSLEHGSDAWKKEQDAVTAYKAELEELNKQYAELTGSNQIDAITKWNVGLSATVQLLDGVGSAMQNIEDDSAKMAGNVISVFSDMADGIMSFIQIQQAAASASGVASASAMPFPYNLAAMASVMGTVLSIFSKIKAMTAGKFAEGGIVGGTSFTGDKLFAQVNSGEMILNKRQQKNLSNMLGNGGQVEFVISGDSLVGVLNNKHNKRNLTR